MQFELINNGSTISIAQYIFKQQWIDNMWYLNSVSGKHNIYFIRNCDNIGNVNVIIREMLLTEINKIIVR